MNPVSLLPHLVYHKL